MHSGDFKRLWKEKFEHSLPKIDQHLSELRAQDMVVAGGRGQSAGDMSFEDAFNLATSLLCASSAERGPNVVRAIDKARLASRTSRYPITRPEKRGNLESSSKSFRDVMFALSKVLPWDKEARRRQPLLKNVSDFLTRYPLEILFEEDRGVVEVRLRSVGTEVPSSGLPKDLYLRFVNDEPEFKPKYAALGGGKIFRANWWLPWVLRHFIDGEPSFGTDADARR